SRIEDFYLRLAFHYIQSSIKIFGQTWVAREAAGMCTSLQDTVLMAIKGNIGNFTLIHDGWTKANNIHVFLGVLVAFIDNQWNYQVQHLNLMLVTWYHNWKWLAQLLVHFMKKHKL
ncbi:hypothetical protein DFH28DRAFT_880219, partial [Melampsora americana]